MAPGELQQQGHLTVSARVSSPSANACGQVPGGTRLAAGNDQDGSARLFLGLGGLGLGRGDRQDAIFAEQAAKTGTLVEIDLDEFETDALRAGIAQKGLRANGTQSITNFQGHQRAGAHMFFTVGAAAAQAEGANFKSNGLPLGGG